MAGCMFFVFAALGEFVVVKVLDLRYQQKIDALNAPRYFSTVCKRIFVESSWRIEKIYGCFFYRIILKTETRVNGDESVRVGLRLYVPSSAEKKASGQSTSFADSLARS